MKQIRKPCAAFAALLLAGLPAAAAVVDETAANGSSAARMQLAEQSPIGEAPAIDDAVLDDLRGGFTTTSGLQVAFGIERVLYVNGALISTTSINVLNTGGGITVVPVAPRAVTNLPNADALSPVTIAPASVGASTGATAPTGTTAETTVPAASDSAVPVQLLPSINSGSVALIQSGPGNVVRPGTLASSSMGAIVQNTLNNQKIQAVTVINATLNSLEILKALNLQSAITSAINDSVRSR